MGRFTSVSNSVLEVVLENFRSAFGSLPKGDVPGAFCKLFFNLNFIYFMSVQLVPYAFTQFYNGSKKRSYCLRRVAGSQEVYTEEDVAREVEEASSLSKGDLTHALGIFMSEMRKILVRGNRVKISNLGTFYMTITSDSRENPEELNVRDIGRVNIRFLPDKALKLVNNAVSPTRSDNNVSFSIKGRDEASDTSTTPATPATPTTPDGGGDPTTPTTPATPGDSGDSYVDPEA
jgi:predicted histone-like DNA-binding protein